MLEKILFLSPFHPFPEGDVGSFLVRLSRPRSDQDGETKYSLAVKYVLQSHSALSSSFREVTFPRGGSTRPVSERLHSPEGAVRDQNGKCCSVKECNLHVRTCSYVAIYCHTHYQLHPFYDLVVTPLPPFPPLPPTHTHHLHTNEFSLSQDPGPSSKVPHHKVRNRLLCVWWTTIQRVSHTCVCTAVDLKVI